jgi:hypothetical protein
MHVALAIAVLNLVLLLTAGFAWGWPNLLLGAAVLTAVIVVFTRGTRRLPVEPAPRTPPMCIAWVPRHAESTENP